MIHVMFVTSHSSYGNCITCASFPPIVAFITPLKYTAYLNQTTVGFNCSIPNATNISFFWHVDGTTRDSGELQARGIKIVINRTIHKSSLIISSTVPNNNTRAMCFGTFHDGSRFRFAQSEEATFHVQGQFVIISS